MGKNRKKRNRRRALKGRDSRLEKMRDQIVSLRVGAVFLGVSQRQVQRLIRQGALKGSGRAKISSRELIAYRARQFFGSHPHLLPG